jgi:putative transposase
MDQLSKPNRKRLRLDSWDYSNSGAYFVTICTQSKQALFKGIEVREMILYWWESLEDRFNNVCIDEFIIMADHLHGIVWILEDNTVQKKSPTVSKIIQWFKTMSTNAYIRGLYEQGWCEFEGRLWQRGFYDRIIRNEKELTAIREYIRSNPERLSGA